MTDAILDAWDAQKAMPPGGPPPAEPPPRGAPDDPWQGAPFVPLGKAGTQYWFFDAAGEIVSLTPRALGQWQDVLSLCGGDQDWLAMHWPAFDKEGHPTGGFNVRGVAGAVMRRCAEIPAFDPAEPRRRYGLWPVAGGAALHLGKTVMWNGEAVRAGFSREGALWPAMAPRPAPAPPGGVDVADALEALLRRWNWAHPDAAPVALGLVVGGMLGATMPWRAHGFVVGEAGSGKTSLLKFMAGLCPMSVYRNMFTAPGIRQLLGETAAMVVIDEAEGDSRNDATLMAVVEILRRASSGEGVAGVMGSSEQVARNYGLAGSALLGAIFEPPLMPQDSTRFTVLRLRRLEGAATDIEDDLAAFTAEHAPALWGRAVASVGRIRAVFAVLRAALVGEGRTRRQADQLGIIAACWWAMTHEPHYDPPDAGHASVAEALAPVRWLEMPEAEGETDSGGNQALQRLMAMPMDMAGDKWLLGQALAKYRELGRKVAEMNADWPGRNDAEGEMAKLDRLLQAHGVRWATMPLKPTDKVPVPLPGMYVAAGSHPRLLRAFDGTPWAGQRWAAAIAQIRDARGGRDAPPVTIGGAKMRTCWVPREALDRLTRDE